MPAFSAQAARPRPALFRALGVSDPPARIEIEGRGYARVEIFKHDSWAATALYQGPTGLVVAKFNRRQPILGVPMVWLGRRLARHEAAVMKRLAGLPSAPAAVGAVAVDGARQENAVARRYVAGHPLRRGERVRAEFFPAFERLLAEVHRRGIAYMDLHKRENVIVGEDGLPYLIDFQVSFLLGESRWARCWPLRKLLTLLQQGDRYHLLKHRLHHEAKSATAKAEAAAARPWWIRAHRAVAVPFRALRRRLLTILGVRQGDGRATSEFFPEDAVRREQALRHAA